MQLYSIDPAGYRLTCHLCGRSTDHPDDVRNRFCGDCRIFLDDLNRAAATLDAVLGRSRCSPRTLDFFRDVVRKLNGRGSPTTPS